MRVLLQPVQFAVPYDKHALRISEAPTHLGTPFGLTSRSPNMSRQIHCLNMWYENWIALREAKAISHLRVLIFGDRSSQLAFVEDARLPKAWINPYLTMTGCKYAAFKALEECKDYSHQEVRIGEIYHLSP